PPTGRSGRAGPRRAPPPAPAPRGTGAPGLRGPGLRGPGPSGRRAPGPLGLRLPGPSVPRTTGSRSSPPTSATSSAATTSPAPSSCASDAAAPVRAGCPSVNSPPSAGRRRPALAEAAETAGLPPAGRDGKTGQTLLRSVLGPMFRQRALAVRAWSGTNLLGGG